MVGENVYAFQDRLYLPRKDYRQCLWGQSTVEQSKRFQYLTWAFSDIQLGENRFGNVRAKAFNVPQIPQKILRTIFSEQRGG